MLCLTDPGTEAAIKKLLSHAEANPFSAIDLKLMMQRRKAPPGNDPAFVVDVPVGYRCVFSYEYQPELGLCRHLSVSVGEKKEGPHPIAIAQLTRMFGFKTLFSDLCKEGLVFPMHEDVLSINVLEPVERNQVGV